MFALETEIEAVGQSLAERADHLAGRRDIGGGGDVDGSATRPREAATINMPPAMAMAPGWAPRDFASTAAMPSAVAPAKNSMNGRMPSSQIHQTCLNSCPPLASNRPRRLP